MGKNINILRPEQNGRLFADDTFKCIFLKENVRILIEISLKFVPRRSINNNPALVQIMVWHWPGDKPLSEAMMVRLLTLICITQAWWVNILRPEQNADILHVTIFLVWKLSPCINIKSAFFYENLMAGTWWYLWYLKWLHSSVFRMIPWLYFNSLRPSDAIWRHRSWSTLAQVMACCLTAPSHHLNQCWLIISEV